MSARAIAGILNIDKPWGWTSHDVVAFVRRVTGQRHVGHAGTLDPRATGVLLVTIGDATRMSAYLMRGRKCYLARMRLGARTTTDDGGGTVICERPYDHITREQVILGLRRLLGDLRQAPPAYSAIKRDGVPAYKLARRGQAASMEERAVRIDAYAVASCRDGLVEVIVWCAAGTYIRALARDLGEDLGCGASIDALRRLSSGEFGVDTSIGLHELRKQVSSDGWRDWLHPTDAAVASWPALVLNPAETHAAAHGNVIRYTGGRVPAREAGAPWAIADPPWSDPVDELPKARMYTTGGALIGLSRLQIEKDGWQPFSVLVDMSASRNALPRSSRSVSTAPGDSEVATPRQGTNLHEDSR